MERVKKENIILNVVLTQYKLLGLNKELNDASFKDLKINLESNQTDNDKLKLELNSREKGKIKNVPKWI